MAAPGYPQMPHGGPPMGGPPMGGPPMGGPPMMGGPPTTMNRPMRRGTPKIVPIIMSAGLAVGVFCGLLFGVGKKSEAIAAAPATGTNIKPEPEPPKPDPGAAPAGLGATAAKPVPDGSGAKPAGAGSAAVAAGSAAPAAGSAVTAPAAEKKTKLTVTVKPDAAAKDAKLIVDGKEVPGMTIELPADKKSVKVEVKSSGYRSVDKKIDIAGGDTAIEFEMAKRSSSGGTPTVRPPKRPDKPPGGGGGGLIDI
ncbi:MAG TPA: hypothetical protein VIV11_05305 [Kofleriaceae bacterium]